MLLIETLTSFCESKVSNQCLCRAIHNDAMIMAGPHEWLFSTTFSTVRRQTPWIRLDRCKDCGENWLIGTDPVFKDQTTFHRIDELTAHEISSKGNWDIHPANRNFFWPDEPWLEMDGYSSLGEWQSLNNNKENTDPCDFRLHCFNNHRTIKQSNMCRCIECMKTFKKSEIIFWTDEVLGIERTALCPYCQLARVIAF